jgi:sugar phosphate isomerase/epimerase
MKDPTPRIYISTGGERSLPACLTAEAFNGSPYGIELSGGAYSDSVEADATLLASSKPVMLHNYFPVPLTPFVLNLSSGSPEALSDSLALCRRALSLSASVGASHYAVHAGFLADVSPGHLGARIPRMETMDRAEGLSRMRDALLELAEFGASHGVRLLVENHALAPFNLDSFGENFLLLVDPDEIAGFVESTNGAIGLLLDVGHLNTSARSLGFDPASSAANLAALVEGYHVSSNDGMSDGHCALTGDDWFLSVLKRDAAFYTVEIHDADKTAWLQSANVLAAALR